MGVYNIRLTFSSGLTGILYTQQLNEQTAGRRNPSEVGLIRWSLRGNQKAQLFPQEQNRSKPSLKKGAYSAFPLFSSWFTQVVKRAI